MRQTSKRARRSRLLMIFILVLLIALVLWGLAALADRLLHYGANATVSAKDADQPSAITPTPETADDTPKNTYDPACFYRDGEFLRYESSTVTSRPPAGHRLAARRRQRRPVCHSPRGLPRLYRGLHPGGRVF